MYFAYTLKSNPLIEAYVYPKGKEEEEEDEDEDEDENEDGRTCRDMSCIAPKCGERSRGPRFSYLCVKHSDTPRKKIEKWQERRRESRA